VWPSASEVTHDDIGEFHHAEVPYYPEGASIEIVRGDERLAVFRAPAAPRLDVVFPSADLPEAGGTLHYKADGDGRVSLAVRASADDGATWTALVLPERSGTVDLRALLAPLAGDECLVEVRASAGYHTAAIRSDSFRLRPREREISAWSSATRVRRDEPVDLVAIADNGAADSWTLQWFSDINGEIGAGARLITTALKPGRHVIEVRGCSPLLRPGRIEVQVD
jgi:hypothetical protein